MSERSTSGNEHDPLELDHGELSNEWHDLVEILRGPIDDEDDDEKLWTRRRELWEEMKSRVDVEPPECPECGAQSWSQAIGDPKTCGGCGLYLGFDHEELIREVDGYWESVLAGPREADRDV